MIGTSGWQYKHWKSRFYPEDLVQAKWLEYFTQNFNTVEVNNSFYRLPSSETFANWYSKTPQDFRFALKMSRYVSRIKRLRDDEGSTELFLKNASTLKEKLEVVLVQLPPNLKFDLKLLKNYLELVKSLTKVRFAYEFRHQSWFKGETYSLLNKFNSALTVAQSSRWPEIHETTADFTYIRFHGPGDVYGSNYPEKMLETWAEKIKKWQEQGLDNYVYFNNDAQAFAVKNAQTLKKLLQ